MKHEKIGLIFIDHAINRMAVASEKKKTGVMGYYFAPLIRSMQDKQRSCKGGGPIDSVEHQPGQIFCNIHPILMFDEKIKKVLLFS